MVRVLLLGLVIFVVMVFLRRIFASSSSTRSESARLESAAMVKCSHCELHVPESEAIKSDEQYYCSAEHKMLKEDNTR